MSDTSKPTWIPVFEPEVIEAGAKPHAGDDHKEATTMFTKLRRDGILVESRYGKAHEIELMLVMVMALPERLRQLLVSIFCDSKAPCCYTVEVRRGCRKSDAAQIARGLEIASGGHNGITVQSPAGVLADLDPEWTEP